MKNLTHVDSAGKAAMVDVTSKPETARTAVARGSIRMRMETLDVIRANGLKKGDVQAVARLAGIMGAKRTPELIPLCHTLPLGAVDVALSLDDKLPGIRAEATVSTVAQTGVEMEALTAVSVALLTVYDMAKAIDRDMYIGEIELIEKRGGRNPGRKTAEGWNPGV
ncbi:MAG: cyclic pyranopterin monophosphate synthase MoaC [Gemmatimonadaceae bacterium]|nr:cyclic pyranopterin monophosphate synthase MoaC [Gemmatimonadaceae bacterium]